MGKGVSSRTSFITKQLHMQGMNIVTHHLNLVDLLINVIVSAEPNGIVEFLFELAKPDLRGTVNIGFEKFLGVCFA